MKAAPLWICWGAETMIIIKASLLPGREAFGILSDSFWYIRGWGQELNRQVGSTTQWYLADHLGSIRATADATGGLMSTYNYDPYGTPQGTSTPQDFGYTGEPHNASSGLVHLRARWYNTTSSMFQTHDPFRGWSDRPMSLHPYMYVYNDPINWVDLTGWNAEWGIEDDRTENQWPKRTHTGWYYWIDESYHDGSPRVSYGPSADGRDKLGIPDTDGSCSQHAKYDAGLVASGICDPDNTSSAGITEDPGMNFAGPLCFPGLYIGGRVNGKMYSPESGAEAF